MYSCRPSNLVMLVEGRIDTCAFRVMTGVTFIGFIKEQVYLANVQTCDEGADL